MTWSTVTSLGSLSAIASTTEKFLPSDGSGIPLSDAFQVVAIQLQLKPLTGSPTVVMQISIYPRLVAGGAWAQEPARRFEILPQTGNAWNLIPLAASGLGAEFRIGLIPLAATHNYDAQGSYSLDV